MISVVINCDTRPGCGAEVNTTGDHGEGSLMGVRSWDFLTDGVINKLNFFWGHDLELILYIDEHEPLPESVHTEILEITRNINFKMVCRPHQRSVGRWNEFLYLDALKMASGKYIAHFDADCAAFRASTCDITMRYIGWLESGGYKFICQPTTLTREEHGMWWASSRFFICRHDALDFVELEKCVLDESHRAGRWGHCPALEHVLGRMAGDHGVLYPPADWSQYMVFSWSRYHRGVLRKLNIMNYPDVVNYILGCGIHGPNDVISVPL